MFEILVSQKAAWKSGFWL